MIEPAPAKCSRGEIWMLDWTPGRGSEQMGFRPGVIVQCDEGNHADGALTTQGRNFSFYVPVPKDPAMGRALSETLGL
jgi:mRNA interferase MazF